MKLFRASLLIVGLLIAGYLIPQPAAAHPKPLLEQRLDKAVKNGKITSEQKQRILAKIQELKVAKSSLEGKPKPERRQAIKKLKQDFRKWAREQHLPKGGGWRMFGKTHHH